MSAPATRHRALRRLALSGVSLIAALCTAEVGLRVLAHVRNRGVLENALRAVAPPTDEPFVGLAKIIRLSPDEHIVYELQPNLVHRTYHGFHVDTNSRGFRGPEIEAASESTITLVGLGDSLLFGHGVA